MPKPKKNNKPRGKTPKGASSSQPSSSASGGSLEFPPPTQEISPLDPSAESEITEPTAPDNSVPSSFLHHYPGNLPASGSTDPVDVRVQKEISVNNQEREEALKQKIQEITSEMKRHLNVYMASEKGSGFLKKTLIPGFLRDKGFSNEEIAEEIGKLDDKNYQKKLVSKAVARASVVFSQDKVSATQIWQNDDFTGYSIGVLQSSLNGIIDDECRRIIAEKGGEKKKAEEEEGDKSPKTDKIMEIIFKNPEYERKISAIADKIIEKHKKLLDSSGHWEGYTEENAKDLVRIYTEALIRNSAKEILERITTDIKGDKEKEAAMKAIENYLFSMVFSENKKS